jgi:hypothetical protein
MKCAHIHVHCDSVQQKFVLQLAAFTQLENNECFPKPSPLKCLPLNHKCLTNFRHRRFIEHWDTHLMRGIEGTNVLVIAPPRRCPCCYVEHGISWRAMFGARMMKTF